VRKIGAPVRIALVAALVAGAGLTVSATAATTAAATGPFTVRGSVEQVHVTGIATRAKAELLNSKGQRVALKAASAPGGLIFYKVKPGAGYRVHVLGGPTSKPVIVRTAASAPWNPDVYKQSIPKIGYGYLTTRDGTKLAYSVHPPTTPAGLGTPDVVLPDTGLPYSPPWPTLIEYSGYGYARPSGPESGIAVLANLMGFAVVDINMRGTGCSGGAYNFFETLQNLDGYDIIETVARQPWVKNHKVGMMGISFGAISQLFTAQTHPPSLSAISPLSTIDATATTLYPGGILNDGFAVAWANERQQNAQPATAKGRGQSWAWDRIQEGDTVCKDNQALHGEAQDLPKTIAENSHYNAAYADTLDPITFVHKINVPTFMACQWQDEQTGGHCPDLVEHFTGTKKKWFTFTNGVHVDSLDPETFNRWYDFLQLYVNKQAPMQNAALPTLAAPVVYQEAMGLPQEDVVALPPDPIQAIPSYDAALDAFEALPQVRVLFDNGAGGGPLGIAQTGDPYPGFERSFSQFPIKGTVAQRWYLGAKGTLTPAAPKAASIDGFTADANALPKNNYTGGTGGGSLWGNASQWAWNWKPNPVGTAVSYVTDPLKADTGVVGSGAIHLWIRSSTPDVDLQATISEVDPSGHETFVQNGWIRGSVRKLAGPGTKNIFARQSSLLEPVTSLLAKDVAPMPKNAFTQVVLPLYYSGHVYRQGTRIRITIAAPNGSQPIWSFSHTQPKGKASVAIAMSKAMPSSLYLPVIPGLDAPTAQPPCPSLRNQPCRTYVPLVNKRLAR
jgi:predicted acyl esterase